jgi:hypothetical protein
MLLRTQYFILSFLSAGPSIPREHTRYLRDFCRAASRELHKILIEQVASIYEVGVGSRKDSRDSELKGSRDGSASIFGDIRSTFHIISSIIS